MWALFWIPPLLVMPTVKGAFRMPKLVASELLALVVLLLLSWQLRGVKVIRWRAVWKIPAIRATFPILLVAAIGLLTSAHPFHVRRALPSLIIGFACLVAWSQGVSVSRLERLLRGLWVPAMVLATLAIVQFHGIYRPFSFVDAQEVGRVGITSLAGSVGELGAYLVLPCLFAQHGLWQARGRRRLFWALALVVNLYALAISQTLVAVASLAVASALLWWGLLPRRKAVTATLVGAVLLLGLVVGVEPLRHRVVNVSGVIQRAGLNAALTGRLDGWAAAAWMLREHPLTGVGHGAYRAEFSAAKLALIEEGFQFYRGHLYPVFVNAHSDLLEAAAEWGLAGILALIWGFWILSAQVRRRGARTDTSASGDRALAVAGLGALAVQSLGYFPFRTALLAYPALLLVAWVLSDAEEGTR